MSVRSNFVDPRKNRRTSFGFSTLISFKIERYFNIYFYAVILNEIEVESVILTHAGATRITASEYIQRYIRTRFRPVHYLIILRSFYFAVGRIHKLKSPRTILPPITPVLLRAVAVRAIFSTVDKLECPYDRGMPVLSSTIDASSTVRFRCLNRLLRPGISISSRGRRAPIKETKCT